MKQRHQVACWSPGSRGREGPGGRGWDRGDFLWARGLSLEHDTHYALCQWLRWGPAVWEWFTAPAA